MPHARSRHAIPSLLKRLKLWPVIGVLGPRQVGKTTLLRDQLASHINAQFLTLDKKENKDPAEKAPDHFIRSRLLPESSHEKKCLILDEVQKVPDLFDAVKAEVDERRYPGRFILSGSTEFSRKTGIRESLTGRIGISRLYPMTLAELYERNPIFPWVQFQPKKTNTAESEISMWLDRGGMPGICFLRDSTERSMSFESWLDTTCYRDLQQVHGARLSGDLAKEILTSLARSENPTAAEVAAKLKVDVRRIKSHIEALEALFVLSRVDPHSLGISKPRYFIFDAGLAEHLGASHLSRLKIWAMNECLAQYEYSGNFTPKIRYYESSKHSHVDFVIESRVGKVDHKLAVLFTDEAAPSTYTVRALEAFQKKIKTQGDFNYAILAPIQERYSENNHYQVIPWSWMG